MDDAISFRQFSKKSGVDGLDDVCSYIHDPLLPKLNPFTSSSETSLGQLEPRASRTIRQTSTEWFNSQVRILPHLPRAVVLIIPIGFSDQVYAEAYVVVHQFDILLGVLHSSCLSSYLPNTQLPDVLIVNQTPDTMQNLIVDFATLGDLKLVERPTTYTIGPHNFQSVKATIKVRHKSLVCGLLSAHEIVSYEGLLD